MTLEDFFTLTEMNNGLTAPSRVRELITVMQKERDCIVKNAADSTRQRSAVASVIAATENKECLDLFIQLDGLHFISNWLKDAQNLSKNSSDNIAEESIFHLFRALEKLHLDYEKPVAFEIWTTVEILIDHKSSDVQDKARVLLESWKAKKCSIDVSLSDVDKARDLNDDETRETSAKDNGHELTRDDQVVSTSLEAVQPEQVESAPESNKIIDPPTEDEKPVDHASSSPTLPKPTMETCSPDSSRQAIVTNSDIHSPKSKTSEGRPHTSSSDAIVGMEDLTEQSSQKNSNAGSENPSDEDLSNIDLRAVDNGKGDGDDDGGGGGGDANSCGNSDAITPKECGDKNGCISPKSFSGEKSWGKFLSGIKEYLSDEDLTNDYAFGKKQMDMESNSAAKKSPGVEIDYEMVDPLEVARQVAIEVEREIVDYRQQRCSTSPNKLTRSNTLEPKSPVSGKQSPASEGSPMDAAGNSNSSNDSTDRSENHNPQEMETSQVLEAAQEEEPNVEKSPCNFFDLNQEVFSEDYDHHQRPEIQSSTPVSVVSASRASAADPKLPCVPLQFEGNLGWKGSALTSAFRRVPESDFSTGGSSSNNSKQRQGLCLDFDLNVTEAVDELSVEMNSKRSEHLEIDLNRMSGDGGSRLLDWRIGNNWSPSPSSSQQPKRNIDLNDGPSFLNAKNATSQNVNIKLDSDSAISIMGTRVEVNRKDFSSQTPELASDINSGRMGNFMGIGPAVPYVHSLGYGCSNFASGQVMPFSSPIYGPARPIPYMVDSRGMPVIPHTGSSTSLPAAFAQQPFMVNMNGPMPSNGVGPPRGSFDLNSGMLLEGGNKDPAGLGLFLNSAYARPMGEPGLQPTMSSAVGGKRKEPDSGYNDHYYPAKHYTPPPWKQS